MRTDEKHSVAGVVVAQCRRAGLRARECDDGKHSVGGLGIVWEGVVGEHSVAGVARERSRAFTC